MASRTVRTRPDLASSTHSNVGADNVPPNIKQKGKVGAVGVAPLPIKSNKTFAQRTRSALGDIGNRVLKKPTDGDKQVGSMKSAGSTKSIPGDLKAGENFALPAARAPRATSRQDTQNPQKQLARSNSANVPGQARKALMKPEAKAVVSTNLQRSHSTQLKTLRDNEVLKPQSKGLKDTKQISQTCKNLPGALVIQSEKENVDSELTKKPLQGVDAKVIKKPLEEVDVKVAQLPEEKLSDDSVTLFEKKVEEKTESEKKEDETTVAVAAKVDVAYTTTRYDIIDVDADDDKNPLLVKEYIQDICHYLFKLEKNYPVRVRYLEGRLVNSRMRAVLLDWLVEVHHQFGFMPETLYMAAKTLDRYLQKEKRITRKQLQLVGVTSMYIAAKYEEVCTPTVLDFSAVSDNAFSAADVRNMEREMLTALNYDLAPPPAVFFLRRFSKAAGAPMLVHGLAKYIMELSMVDYSTCHLFPSEQAAASLALSLMIFDKKKPLPELWTSTMEHYSSYPVDSLKGVIAPVASVLAKVYEEPLKLKAVYNKYARNRLSRISLAPELGVKEWKNRVLKEI